MDGKMNIGEFARRAGVSIDTARYYERRGLLTPERLDNNYRLYGPAELERIKLIRKAAAAGFSLSEIREIIRLLQAGKRQCAAYANHARHKLQELDERIRALQAARRELEGAIAACEPAAAECRFVVGA